jgi:23S rRNA (uracil1939-C5)-methyltransferase
VKPGSGRPPAGVRLIEVEELELRIEKLVAGGDGLARYEGVPLFVPRSAPGDRIRARVVERRPDYGRAEILEVLEPGPGRREPPCPHFGECGGCDLQHLDEETQLRGVATAVVETLRRLSGLDLPAPREVLAGTPWGYRLRTQVHTAADASGVRVGYHARGSRRLVPIRRCPVLVPELEREVVELAGRLGEPPPRRIDLAAGDGGAVASSPPLPGLGGGDLRRRVGEFEYAYDARCFFQGHAGLLEPLVERVTGPWTGETAFDLYGGVGLFALPLSRRYRRVVLVEGDRVAVRYARRNVRVARAESVETVGQAIESWIGRGLPDDADRVVVDPPRPGLSTVVRRLLVSRAPRRLTYVSCHPAALARDLRELAERYRVESVVLAHLFPQTGHMETVVQLARSS